jgi:hypothetical protein
MINAPCHIVNKRINSSVLRHGPKVIPQVFVSHPSSWYFIYLFVCYICQVTLGPDGVAVSTFATRLMTVMVKVFSTPESTSLYTENDKLS